MFQPQLKYKKRLMNLKKYQMKAIMIYNNIIIQAIKIKNSLCFI